MIMRNSRFKTISRVFIFIIVLVLILLPIFLYVIRFHNRELSDNPQDWHSLLSFYSAFISIILTIVVAYLVNRLNSKNARLSLQYEAYNFISRKILDFKISYNENFTPEEKFHFLEAFLIELLYFENTQLFLFYHDQHSQAIVSARGYIGNAYQLLAHRNSFQTNTKFEAWELPGFLFYDQFEQDYISESKSRLDDVLYDLQEKMIS